MSMRGNGFKVNEARTRSRKGRFGQLSGRGGRSCLSPEAEPRGEPHAAADANWFQSAWRLPGHKEASRLL
jgi:hypothetical protein